MHLTEKLFTYFPVTVVKMIEVLFIGIMEIYFHSFVWAPKTYRMSHICQLPDIEREQRQQTYFKIIYSLVAWEWLERLGGGWGKSADHCNVV